MSKLTINNILEENLINKELIKPIYDIFISICSPSKLEFNPSQLFNFLSIQKEYTINKLEKDFSKHLFSSMDCNDDGVVDFNDFINFIYKCFKLMTLNYYNSYYLNDINNSNNYIYFNYFSFNFMLSNKEKINFNSLLYCFIVKYDLFYVQSYVYYDIAPFYINLKQYLLYPSINGTLTNKHISMIMEIKSEIYSEEFININNNSLKNTTNNLNNNYYNLIDYCKSVEQTKIKLIENLNILLTSKSINVYMTLINILSNNNSNQNYILYYLKLINELFSCFYCITLNNDLVDPQLFETIFNIIKTYFSNNSIEILIKYLSCLNFAYESCYVLIYNINNLLSKIIYIINKYNNLFTFLNEDANVYNSIISGHLKENKQFMLSLNSYLQNNLIKDDNNNNNTNYNNNDVYLIATIIDFINTARNLIQFNVNKLNINQNINIEKINDFIDSVISIVFLVDNLINYDDRFIKYFYLNKINSATTATTTTNDNDNNNISLNCMQHQYLELIIDLCLIIIANPLINNTSYDFNNLNYLLPNNSNNTLHSHLLNAKCVNNLQRNEQIILRKLAFSMLKTISTIFAISITNNKIFNTLSEDYNGNILIIFYNYIIKLYDCYTKTNEIVFQIYYFITSSYLITKVNLNNLNKDILIAFSNLIQKRVLNKLNYIDSKFICNAYLTYIKNLLFNSVVKDSVLIIAESNCFYFINNYLINNDYTKYNNYDENTCKQINSLNEFYCSLIFEIVEIIIKDNYNYNNLNLCSVLQKEIVTFLNNIIINDNIYASSIINKSIEIFNILIEKFIDNNSCLYNTVKNNNNLSVIHNTYVYLNYLENNSNVFKFIFNLSNINRYLIYKDDLFDLFNANYNYSYNINFLENIICFIHYCTTGEYPVATVNNTIKNAKTNNSKSIIDTSNTKQIKFILNNFNNYFSINNINNLISIAYHLYQVKHDFINNISNLELNHNNNNNNNTFLSNSSLSPKSTSNININNTFKYNVSLTESILYNKYEDFLDLNIPINIIEILRTLCSLYKSIIININSNNQNIELKSIINESINKYNFNFNDFIMYLEEAHDICNEGINKLELNYKLLYATEDTSNNLYDIEFETLSIYTQTDEEISKNIFSEFVYSIKDDDINFSSIKDRIEKDYNFKDVNIYSKIDKSISDNNNNNNYNNLNESKNLNLNNSINNDIILNNSNMIYKKIKNSEDLKLLLESLINNNRLLNRKKLCVNLYLIPEINKSTSLKLNFKCLKCKSIFSLSDKDISYDSKGCIVIEHKNNYCENCKDYLLNNFSYILNSSLSYNNDKTSYIHDNFIDSYISTGVNDLCHITSKHSNSKPYDILNKTNVASSNKFYNNLLTSNSKSNQIHESNIKSKSIYNNINKSYVQESNSYNISNFIDHKYK